MKKMLFVGAIIASAVAANSFAMEIKAGKLINHREWTTGNVNTFSFKEIKSAKLIEAFKLKSKLKLNHANGIIPLDSYDTAYAANDVMDATGVVGEPIDLYGHNFVVISNFYGTTTQTYDVVTDICTWMSGAFTCASSQDKLSLDVGGTAQIDHSPYLQTIFSKPGTYQVIVSTSIVQAGQKVVFATSNFNTIEVNEAPKA